MANVQYYDVILKPVVTEKSMNAMSEKKYTFLVHTETKRRGMTFGKTAKTKKAIVQLTEDSKEIEIFTGL